MRGRAVAAQGVGYAIGLGWAVGAGLVLGWTVTQPEGWFGALGLLPITLLVGPIRMGLSGAGWLPFALVEVLPALTVGTIWWYQRRRRAPD